MKIITEEEVSCSPGCTGTQGNPAQKSKKKEKERKKMEGQINLYTSFLYIQYDGK